MQCEIIQRADGQPPYLECDSEATLIRDFFEADIQDTPDFAALILDRASDISASFEISGNLFILSVNQGDFRLENQFDDSEKLSGDWLFLETLLKDWVKAFSRRN